MNFSNLLIELDGPIAWLTVNRPDKLNALNQDTLTELHQAIQQLKITPEVRVIVLSGAGSKAFVAGADIAEMRNISPIQARDFSKLGQDLMLAIEQCGKPVIAIVGEFDALPRGLTEAVDARRVAPERCVDFVHRGNDFARRLRRGVVVEIDIHRR